MKKYPKTSIRWWNFLLFLVCAIMIGNCQTRRSVIISGECEVPCWRQIIPGETNVSGVMDIISQFDDVLADPGLQTEGWNIFDTIIFFELRSKEKVRIYFIDGFVVRILFEQIPESITFGDVVDAIGAPEIIARSTRLARGPLWSEGYHKWIFALSPTTGVVWGYDAERDENLTANTKVSTLQFFDPEKYDLLFEEGFIVYYEYGLSDRVVYYDWSGYGNHTELYK